MVGRRVPKGWFAAEAERRYWFVFLGTFLFATTLITFTADYLHSFKNWGALAASILSPLVILTVVLMRKNKSPHGFRKQNDIILVISMIIVTASLYGYILEAGTSGFSVEIPSLVISIMLVASRFV
jgi:hypothetical protein